MAEVSRAAENYGRALCLAPDRARLPLDELSPDEQACVTRTGLGWADRVEARMGAGLAGDGVQRWYLTRDGMPAGEVTYADGQVMLCREDQNCRVVGAGPVALEAALEAMDMLGIRKERVL